MNILFVHQNFPGQYPHLARHLAAQPGNRVVALSQRPDGDLPGVRILRYRPKRDATPRIHHYLRALETGVLNAQAVVRAALALKKSGFIPDLMLGHNGWGEIWYLKEVFPQTPLIGYFEFFYRLHGADVGFDPAQPPNFDAGPRLSTRNLGNLLGLEACDLGQCPTKWQYSRYPERYRPMLRIVHDGIDTDRVRPDPAATLAIPASGNEAPLELAAGDEIVTYVARNLEPYRGFPSFMRSLPAIQKARPRARILIVGGDETSYGAMPREGRTYRQLLLDELCDALDLSCVRFLGKVPYSVFLKLLQVSAAHVYLTYPFVLSWSMLEAMAAGCLVVGSRTPPVEEVIRDGENGLLADFFSPEEIAEKVIAALAAPGDFAALRQNARQSVIEAYDLQRICLPGQRRLIEEARALCPTPD
ncbi:MAG: glycosyltransferase family 4 protein [Candidatus Accumulibacter sp.]|jgi:glycosyltransferase involved in cell wall biosynthesis|nr:glycosyltransferase family 4 protein [Accumulibacter sp.]